MLYKEIPENFNPLFDGVGCFCEYKGKIILLHRQTHKAEGDTWGLPSGKIENNETIFEAMAREIEEELGLNISCEKINYFGKVYSKFPDYDFIYHIFHTELIKFPEITINNNEHKDFLWISPQEALEMELIKNLPECIKLFYKI